MNRSNLIKRVAQRLSLKEKEVEIFINAWEEELGKALMEEHVVSLMGFGTFTLWKQSERPGRNPRNNSLYMIAPRNSAKFKPGKNLLDYLNKKAECPRRNRRNKERL